MQVGVMCLGINKNTESKKEGDRKGHVYLLYGSLGGKHF
jgi:hypothetical protein